MERIYNVIEKIGKRNLILIAFITCVILISSLYATFSLSTASEGISVIDGVKTLKFILGKNDTENSITIASGSSKNIAITVSNKEEIKLKYGIYYSSSDDLEDVEIGYHHSTEYLPNGLIEPKKDYLVTIRVENNSDDAKIINFGLIYGLEKGGDLILEEDQHFLEQKWNFPLSEVAKNSYVEYVGSNGCVEDTCKGINNYKQDEKKNGYCGDETATFKEEGWKVAYTQKGSAYITSSGSPECIDQAEMSTTDLAKLLNETAIKYCNIDYAYKGICNEKNTWAMNSNDFYNITSSKLNEESCIEEKNNSCGNENDLIDIGSFYWLSTSMKNGLLYYQPISSYYTDKANNIMKGLRPIIKLAPSVIVTKGSGTKDDPYQIKNEIIPTYDYTIIYNGNGATDGDTKSSDHQTNKLQKLNKNGFSLTYQVKLSEIATFDDSYCDTNGICHESSVENIQTKQAKFLGWSTSMDDKEAMYTDEQEVMNLSNSSNDIIVNLYAVWEYGVFTLPNIQERDGYEILGWYTEKEGGEKVGNPNDKYTNTDKLTLYARWQEKTS